MDYMPMAVRHFGQIAQVHCHPYQPLTTIAFISTRHGGKTADWLSDMTQLSDSAPARFVQNGGRP